MTATFGPPLQRSRGTIYGGARQPAAGDLTMALPVNPSVENSGSLTGHILAQGWYEAAQTDERNNAKVLLILGVVLASVVLLSVLVIVVANSALDGALDGFMPG